MGFYALGDFIRCASSAISHKAPQFACQSACFLLDTSNPCTPAGSCFDTIPVPSAGVLHIDGTLPAKLYCTYCPSSLIWAIGYVHFWPWRDSHVSRTHLSCDFTDTVASQVTAYSALLLV